LYLRLLNAAALPIAPPCTLACASQRRLELEALYGTQAWNVELVADEQWGRVLVAQRDFEPGEVVIRSPS
jgi:hypothetical protein